MIFTKIKENMVKKANLKRITRHEGYCIGDAAYLGDENVKYYLSDRDEFKIEDRSKMGYELFLLVRSMHTGKEFIFKAIDECLCVKLGLKELVENKESFERITNWEAHTKLKIDSDGEVCSI